MPKKGRQSKKRIEAEASDLVPGPPKPMFPGMRPAIDELTLMRWSLASQHFWAVVTPGLQGYVDYNEGAHGPQPIEWAVLQRPIHVMEQNISEVIRDIVRENFDLEQWPELATLNPDGDWSKFVKEMKDNYPGDNDGIIIESKLEVYSSPAKFLVIFQSIGGVSRDRAKQFPSCVEMRRPAQ